MKTIDKLEEIHPSELERIRATLRQRFDVGKRGNIVELAFGAAERNGQIDPARRNAVCFYVRCKRMPRAIADRIPECVRIRIRRGKQYCRVCLETDVIDIGSRKVRPTGNRIRHLDSTSDATAGCVVAWKLPGQSRLTWGLLTVGHLFKHVSTVPEASQRVLILSTSTPLHEFRGTVVARSKSHTQSQLDAAIVKVSRGALVRAGLIPKNSSTTGKKVRSVNDLRMDRGRSGFSFPLKKRVPFVVSRFLPISEIVADLGPLRNVVEVNSESGNAFGVGRSGSVWVVKKQVACVQHAGLQPGFRRGWGQSLESILEWAVAQLARQGQLPISDVDLRLIRII